MLIQLIQARLLFSFIYPDLLVDYYSIVSGRDQNVVIPFSVKIKNELSFFLLLLQKQM